nr:uncharacterized protein LOC111429342 [Onthophagus taurus]
MDKGIGHMYKGKSLSEIDINPEVDEADSDKSEDETPLANEINDVVTNNFIEDTTPQPCSSVSAKQASKLTGRTPWTTEQIGVVTHYFKTHIKEKKAPKKHECEQISTFIKK